MSPTAEPVALDLGDLDAVAVASGIVLAVRRHAIEASVDTAATVSAPEGWHRLVITGRSSGHVVLGVRYHPLTRSRWHNVARALERQGWDLDDDADGSTRRYPPGTDATMVAFDVLAVLTLAGAPSDVRQVTARDGTGAAVALGG
jgi:hypothetical protein